MAKTHVGPVFLEPEEHVYIHRETGKKYTSVTSIISLIEPEFNTEEVAQAIVNQSDKNKKDKYIGKTKDQIIEHWQAINDEANEYGTRVHDILERYILSNGWYIPKDDFEKSVIEAYDALKINNGLEIYPERIMFSEEYELAGTSDLVIDIDDTFFQLGDWKTNRKIRYYNEFGNKTLLKPFDHFQDCQYNVYSLQLSTYALMYEMETGKKCRNIWIGYWDRKTKTLSKIPIAYLKHDAKNLLEYHKYHTQLKAQK